MWERLKIGHERLDAGNPCAHYSLQRSLAAYAFAGRFLKGKRTLDAACGAGHGTNFLAGFARSLVGLDRSLEALSFAAQKNNGASFCCGDLFQLPFQNGSFDAALSFQVIEHFAQPDPFFRELSRVLKKDGVLFVTTLNHKQTSHGLNPFHVKEYTFAQFAETVRAYFPDARFYGVFGSPRYLEARRREAFWGRAALRFDRFNLRNRLPRRLWEGLYTAGTALVNAWVSVTYPAARQLQAEDFEIREETLDEALDFIAVCTKELR